MNTRDVLLALGFQEDWQAVSDELPGYVYDFGNLRLTAAQAMSRFLQPVFMLGGVSSDSRSIGMIQFEMPLRLDSVEQGAAWLLHGIGSDFKPDHPTWWLAVGRQHRDALPWISRLKTHERRPQCSVAREWFRTAARQLREHALSAADTDLAVFSFDGEVLRIRTGSLLAAMPAAGTPWPVAYAILARRMDFIHQRIPCDPVHISAWEGQLTIFNRVFEIVEERLQSKGDGT